LTIIGLVLGHLLSGAAVIETVFTVPGIGRLLVESIYARDYPVIQGCLLFISLLYVFVNLVIDLLYPLFDPRIKL
ncbi:MAG: ABC transporter permease subunit, partial [Proteobacteria bacterium]|nr:ABC transporter permease subunit [Pseudomonadota bacterium]